MLDENSINVYESLSGKENVKHDIVLISKDIDGSEKSEYYSFNVKSLTLSRVDENIAKFMSDNNIISVKSLDGSEKEDIVMKLETVPKISKSSETISIYKELLLKNKKPTL